MSIARSIERRRLRPARTSVGSHRRRVRDHAPAAAHDARDPVDAAQHLLRRAGHERADRIRTHVGEDLGPEPHQRAVASGAELHRLDLRPAVGERDHRLRTRLLPSHGPAEPSRDRGDRVVLGVDLQLGPERPADVGRDRANAIAPDPQRLGQVVADVERDLRRDPHREGAVVGGDHRDPVRLHRRRRDPLVHEPAADHDVRTLERIVGSDVGPNAWATFVPNSGHSSGASVRHRRLHIRPRPASSLVLDGHQLRGVDGLPGCLGDHDGDDLAHEPDDVSRQGLAAEQPFDLRRACRPQPCPTVEAAPGPGRLRRRHPPRPERSARPRRRPPSIRRVRHDGADEGGVERTRDLDVLEVSALPSEEPRVLGPESRHAEHGGRRRRHGADTRSGRSGRHAEDGDRWQRSWPLAGRRTRGHDGRTRDRGPASGRSASPRSLASPVGFTFMPGGRLVYLERNTGWLRFRNLQTGVRRPGPPHPRTSTPTANGARWASRCIPPGRPSRSCTSS